MNWRAISVSGLGWKSGPYVGHGPDGGNSRRRFEAGRGQSAGDFLEQPLADGPHLAVVAGEQLDEVRIGGGGGRQAEAGVEAVVQQIGGAVGVDGKASRRQLARAAAELVLAGLADFGHGGEQRLAGARMDHRLAETVELVFADAVHADAEVQALAAEAVS